MNKTLKTLLIVGISLFLAGVTVFGISFAAAGGNFGAIDNREVKMQTYTENAENPVSSITIDFKSAGVTVSVEEDIQTLSVEYPVLVNKNGEPLTEIAIKETSGGVTLVENKFWKAYISAFNFTAPQAVLHLPKDRAYALDLFTDTGDITLQGEKLQAQALSLETDTGDIKTSETEIICEKQFSIETDTGRIQLGKISCASLSVESDTGRVSVTDGNVNGNAVFDVDTADLVFTGTFQAHAFKVTSDTGKINALDGCISAQYVHLETDTGDVSVTLFGTQTEYTVSAKTSTGSSNILSGGNGERNLTVSTSTGDIRVDFKN